MCNLATSDYCVPYFINLFCNTQKPEMMTRMPLPNHPRLMMLITGPIIGLISGVVLGLFSFIASKIIKKK
jgi:uncharacterized membrane protein